MRRIDVDEALRLAAAGALLVDVLPQTVYVQEHLPDAMSLPLEQLDPKALADLDRTRPMVVYCFDQH